MIENNEDFISRFYKHLFKNIFNILKINDYEIT